MFSLKDLLTQLGRSDLDPLFVDAQQWRLEELHNCRGYVDTCTDQSVDLSTVDIYIFIPPADSGLKAKLEIIPLPKVTACCSINPLHIGLGHAELSKSSCGPTVDYQVPKSEWPVRYHLYPIN